VVCRLQHLNETHTHYTCETRHDDGIFMTQDELLPQVFHHPKLDLCALHIHPEMEKGSAKIWRDYGFGLWNLWSSPEQLKEGYVSGRTFVAVDALSYSIPLCSRLQFLVTN
jgi:hypothetical protein